MGVTPANLPWLFSTLWWGFLIVVLAGLVLLWQKRSPILAALLGLSLFFPAVGIFFASMIKPMYQGIRHIMLGNIGYILLVVAAIMLGWELTSHQKRNLSWAKPIELLAILVPLAASISSLVTRYNNPVVAKDDIRSLVRFIERTAGENDVVVYSDAIVMLGHDHYQTRPELTFTTLPVYPTLYLADTETALQTLSETYDRIWYVPAIAADERDEAREVRQWLANSSKSQARNGPALPAPSSFCRSESRLWVSLLCIIEATILEAGFNFFIPPVGIVPDVVH